MVLKTELLTFWPKKSAGFIAFLGSKEPHTADYIMPIAEGDKSLKRENASHTCEWHALLKKSHHWARNVPKLLTEKSLEEFLHLFWFVKTGPQSRENFFVSNHNFLENKGRFSLAYLFFFLCDAIVAEDKLTFSSSTWLEMCHMSLSLKYFIPYGPINSAKERNSGMETKLLWATFCAALHGKNSWKIASRKELQKNT